jgi:hypothetical protein
MRNHFVWGFPYKNSNQTFCNYTIASEKLIIIELAVSQSYHHDAVSQEFPGTIVDNR